MSTTNHDVVELVLSDLQESGRTGLDALKVLATCAVYVSFTGAKNHDQAASGLVLFYEMVATAYLSSRAMPLPNKMGGEGGVS